MKTFFNFDILLNSNIHYAFKHSYIIFICISLMIGYITVLDIDKEIKKSIYTLEVLNTEYVDYIDIDYFCKAIKCSYISKVGKREILEVNTLEIINTGIQSSDSCFVILDKLYYRIVYKDDLYYINVTDNLIGMASLWVIIMILFVLTILIIIKNVIFDGVVDSIDNIKRLEYMHKYEVISSLATSVKHEIATPLNVVSSVTEDIKVTTDEINGLLLTVPLDKDKVIEFLELVIMYTLENVEMLETAVSQIYSELDTLSEYKHIKNYHASSDLYTVISLAFKMITKSYSHKSIVVMPEYTISEEFKNYKLATVINMDDMLFMNIIINHIKNSIEANSLLINIKYLEDTIVIIDNGDGVPESVQDKIFNEGFSTKDSDSLSRGNGLYVNKVLLNTKYNSDIILLESILGFRTVFNIKIKLERIVNV